MNAFFDSNATGVTEEDVNELLGVMNNQNNQNTQQPRANAFFDSNATGVTEQDVIDLLSVMNNANKGQTKTAPKVQSSTNTQALPETEEKQPVKNIADRSKIAEKREKLLEPNAPTKALPEKDRTSKGEKPFTVVYNGKTYKEGETIDINGKKVKVEKPADYGQTSISNSKETTKLSNADKKKKQQMENTSREGRWAAEHPVVATALDLASTPITSLGSGVETVEGLITGDTGNKFARNQNNLKEGIRSNIGSDAGKFALDMGLGLGEMMANNLASSALGMGSAGFGVLSGAKAAGEQTMNAMDRGVNTRRASLYGTGAGVLEGAMNAKGLNIIEDKLGTSTVKSLGDVAKNMGAGFLAEGGENLLQESLQTGLDSIINGDNSEYDIAVRNNIANGMDEESAKKDAVGQIVGNILKSGLTGGLFGSVFAGGKMGTKALGDIPQLKAVSDVLSNAKGKLSDFFSVESLESKNLADSANDVTDALRNIDAEQSQIDDITNAMLENGNVVSETESNPYSNLSNSQIEKIISDNAMKSDFTKQTGVELNGTKAENRKAVKDYITRDSNAEITEPNVNNQAEEPSIPVLSEAEQSDIKKRISAIENKMYNEDNVMSQEELRSLMREKAELRKQLPQVESGKGFAKLTEMANQLRNNVDNNADVDYNKVESEVDYGEISRTDDRTRSEGVLRELRKDGELPVTNRANGVEGREFLPANRGDVAEQLRKNNTVFDEKDFLNLKSKDANAVNFRNANSEADTFVKALNTAKANHPEGAAVDGHSIEEIQEIIDNGGSLFLYDDGTAGGAVDSGNLTAVFKDKANNNTPNMGTTIAIAGVKNGAIKGDCFGRFLVNSYSPAGFEPVARMKYGYGFNAEMDAQVKANLTAGKINKEPDVYALKLRDGYDFDTVLANIDKPIIYSQPELDSLPEFEDYDEMLAYRDSLIKDKSEVWMNEDTGLANTTEEFTDGDVISSTEEPLETVASTEEELVPYRPSEGGKAESRGMTNTARMNDIYRGLVKQETDALSEHEIKTNQETFERAFKSILNPEDALKEEQNFRNGTTRMDNSAEDMARGVLLLQDLASQYDEAVENGDTAKATELNIRRTLLMRKYSPATTNVGQTLQSLKMFSHSIEGAELASEKILNDRTRAWRENNVKESKTVDKLSSKLLYAFNKLVEPEKANIELTRNNFDEHYKEVMNTINEESSSFANNFTEEDAKYIANLLNNGVTKEELADMIATKMATGTFGLKPETQAKVNKLFKKNDNLNVNSKEFVENEAEAYRLIANEICANSTIGDKFNAWRYLAMLGNPKTMIRNVFGNNVFGGITSVSNGLSAVVESGIDKTSKALGGNGIDRTKAVLTVKDKGLIDAAKRDADNNRYRQLQGDKYHDNVRTDIEKNKDVWNSKFMRGTQNLVNKGLSDYKSARKKYGTSLAGYLKANGLDASVFDAEVRYNELDKACKKFEYENRLFTPKENAMLRERSELTADVKKLQKARDYAQKQAEYAVFHEDNKVADAITKFSNATRLTHIITEGIMPFKKTPMNILRSGVEYSPLGAVDSIAKTGKLILDRNKADTYMGKDFRGRPIEKQKIKASDVIDSWSKTLTGTGLTILGAYLYDKGILLSSNDEEKYQDQLEGIQNYALKFSADGQDYTATIDFLAPTVMPLLVGAEMVKAYEKNAEVDESFWNNITKLGVNDGANIATSILSPIMETSMLSGVADTLDEIGRARQNNEDANPLGTALWNTSTGYVSQAVPTIAGQFARTFDNTRRSTYSDKEGVERTVDRQITKMKNKIPGLSNKNEAYVDARGNTQKNGLDTGNKALDLLGNAAYQFASPSYIDKVETTDADKMAREVYKATNDDSVFADLKTKKKIDGEPLNKVDYTEYAKVKGESNNTLRNMLVKDERLANMTDVEKRDVLKAINTLSDQIGEATVNEDFETTSSKYAAYMEGGYEGALDELINSAHTTYLGNQLKERGIGNNEITREMLDTGDEKSLNKYSEAEKIAREEYGRKEITKTQWDIYNNRGAGSFRDELKYEKASKEYGVSDTKAFREAVNQNKVESYVKAYNTITQIQNGKDENGSPKFLEYNDTTRKIYDGQYEGYAAGAVGLRAYVEDSKKLQTIGLDKKNTQILVKQNNLKYAQTHTLGDLVILKEIEESGSSQSDWIPRLKAKRLETETAYDIIETMVNGKFPKAVDGMSHKQIVEYYFNKKLD